MARRLRIIYDGVEYELLADTDLSHDGRADTATVDFDGDRYRLTDVDGDGVPDVIRVVRAKGGRELLVHDPEGNRYRRMTDSAALDESIEENASHWFAQATNYTCGPAAITMVLGDLFDLRLPNEQAVWDRATGMRAINDQGMRPTDIEAVINSYGVPSLLVQSDTRQLERLLEVGHEVILMVDADEYWPGSRRAVSPGATSRIPHAVRLLGIDHDAGVAVVSDTGRNDPLFSRLPIPLGALEQAWGALDWLAVVTEVTHDEVRRQLEDEGVVVGGAVDKAGPRHGRLKAVLLPFVVRLERLRDLARRRARRE